MLVMVFTPPAIAFVVWLLEPAPAITFELHFPREVARTEQVTLRIDSTRKSHARWTDRRTLRIDVQDNGETIIPDPVFAQWRQLVVVTPSRRLRPYDDFANDLRFESARVTQKLSDGGVRSSSGPTGLWLRDRPGFFK